MALDDMLVTGLVWYFVFVFSTVCHEAAHALAALRLGDQTAYLGGQVSLDPMPHVRREPIGMVIVPLVSFFLTRGQWMMGWASAPYDPMWAAQYPRRAALMALAGPLANLTLVVIAAVLIRLGLLAGLLRLPRPDELAWTSIVVATEQGFAAGFAMMLSVLFVLNLVLFLFNLLPLPPLDGSALPPLFMDHNTSLRYLEFVRSPAFSLLGLVVAWKVFPSIFMPVFAVAYRLLLKLQLFA
jgi:Zn-dependent protease